MHDATGRWVIVFNGEIYNYQEIRSELARRGICFRSRSDTEVLLEAYKYWGAACLTRLNGMFAFAVYDQGDEAHPPSVFLARDRAGKKPLYYVRQGRSIKFASELKALGHDGRVDLEGLNHYLALGCYPGARCFQEGVRKLPPAHCAWFDPMTGDWREQEWWVLPEGRLPSGNDPDLLTDELAALLTDSVRLRLISDVPVGVFLSGGLDSSLITAAAARTSSAPIKTFTIRIPPAQFDESAYARTVASHFGTDHHELTAEPSSIDVLDEIAHFCDEPLADSSLIPTFIVSRLTRQHVTVALGGDGGDELFGGYPHVRRALMGHRLLGWVPTQLWRASAGMAKHLPNGVKGRGRALAWREGPLLERVWGTPWFDYEARKRLFTSEALAALPGLALTTPELEKRSFLAHPTDPVAALCRLDYATTLPDDFLVKVDRASMMNSLEVRAPFLDMRLVEFAFSTLPSEWKCDGAETRRIQKRLARRWLPPALDINRKQGFSVPLGAWLRTAGANAIRARLEGLPDAIARGAVDAEIEGHMAGRENSSRLFALIMLATCCRQLNPTD